MGIQNKKTTIQDVAKLAGVSITTVSRVVNGNYPVKEATKNKVNEAVKRLNYKPNMLAKALIQSKTHTVGIITPSIENLFFSEVVNAIDSEVSQKKYDIFLCNTKGIAKNERRMINTLIARSVDGIIVIDPRSENVQSGFYTTLSKRIPTVLINAYNDGIDCNFVLNDEKAGMLEALDYLKALGHEHIGFLRGRTSYSYDLKEEIYRQYMMKEIGKEIEQYIIKVKSGNEVDTVNQSCNQVVKFLEEHPGVTAIIACNDWMAYGALNGAKEMKIDVPRELSIIGFDNTVISQISSPKMTTIDHNMTTLGKMAAKRMLDIIERNEKDCFKIIIDTKLVKRDSCGTVSEEYN